MPVYTTEESPSNYADRIGQWVCQQMDTEARKNQGIYFTPIAVARYMATLSNPIRKDLLILDPAAGSGILICALCEYLINSKSLRVERLRIVAYETDAKLYSTLENVLKHLVVWAANKKITIDYDIFNEDFILSCSDPLQHLSDPLFEAATQKQYDIVISNPPYFKLTKSDARSQAALSVVHGQPNIYGLFMAVGAALLRTGGEFIYITPRSFASGPYFRLLRERLFSIVQPHLLHVFHSRKNAFKRDQVLQENVIMKAIRMDGWSDKISRFTATLSSSTGSCDLEQPVRREVDLSFVLNLQSKDKILRIPASLEEDRVLKIVDSWPETLHSLGLEISTGPVVPFRATEFINDSNMSSAKHAPLLWMQHVHPLQVVWPNSTRKPQYICSSAQQKSLLLPNKNYVLLRRFSSKEEKRRLTAGPYFSTMAKSPLVGLENHLNYIYRPEGELSENEAWGIAGLYSSTLLDKYFRVVNGNTQVGATELRVMSLPSHDLILTLGKRIKRFKNPMPKVDSILDELLNVMESHSGLRVKTSGKNIRSTSYTKSSGSSIAAAK